MVLVDPPQEEKRSTELDSGDLPGRHGQNGQWQRRREQIPGESDAVMTMLTNLLQHNLLYVQGDPIGLQLHLMRNPVLCVCPSLASSFTML